MQKCHCVECVDESGWGGEEDWRLNLNFHIFCAALAHIWNQEFKMSESATPFPSGSALNFNRIVVEAVVVHSTPFGAAYYEKVSRWLDVTELPCFYSESLSTRGWTAVTLPYDAICISSLLNGNEARITSLVSMFVIFPNFLWKWRRIRSFLNAVCVNYFRSAVTLS